MAPGENDDHAPDEAGVVDDGVRERVRRAVGGSVGPAATDALRKLRGGLPHDAVAERARAALEAAQPTQQMNASFRAMLDENRRAIDSLTPKLDELPTAKIAEQARLSEAMRENRVSPRDQMDELYRAQRVERDRVQTIEKERLQREARMLELTVEMAEHQQTLVQKQDDMLEAQADQDDRALRTLHLTVAVLVVTILAAVATTAGVIVAIIAL